MTLLCVLLDRLQSLDNDPYIICISSGNIGRMIANIRSSVEWINVLSFQWLYHLAHIVCYVVAVVVNAAAITW